MRRVAVGGDTFAVHDAGRGRPVVLLHGFPLDHSMWRAQIEALGAATDALGAAAPWRVIAPDLRGFGGSVVSPGKVGMERHADDVAGLLDALAVREPVVLCGLSMGGYVALQCAQRHAGRIAALVLCDTRAAADDAEAARARRRMADEIEREGAGLAAVAMLPKLLAPRTLETRPRVVEELRGMILAAHPAGIAASQRGMAERPDTTALLARIRVPVLVLVGEHDEITPPTAMRMMAAAIPGARFVEVRDAGHMAPMENPAAVNAALSGFLRAAG